MPGHFAAMRGFLRRGGWWSLAGRGDEACLVCGDHCLCAIAEAEFAEDVTDVCLYHLVAEHEAVGDLLV